MEFILEILIACLYFTLMAAWRTLPIFLVVLAIDLLFHRRIPARVLCGLWILVLCRLLLPVSITSPLSPSHFSDQALDKFSQLVFYTPQEPEPEFEVATFTLRNGQTVSQPILPADASEELRTRAEAYAASVHEKQLAESNSPPVPSQNDASSPWEEILAIVILTVWPCVVLGIVLRQWIAYRRFAKLVKTSPLLNSSEFTEKLGILCRECRISRVPSIRIVDSLTVPAMFGIWRLTLCLPSNTLTNLSSRELDWVLRHELAHLKWKDAIVLSAATLIRALHWFHPIAWVAMNRLKLRIEQAADDRATRKLQATEIVDYGQLLVRYAGSLSNSQPFALNSFLSMASSRNLRRRLESLGTYPANLPIRTKMALASLFCFLSLFGLTDARPKAIVQPADNVRRDWWLSASYFDKNDDLILSAIQQEQQVLQPTPPREKEEKQPVQFDVRAVVERLIEVEPEINVGLFIKTWFAGEDKLASVEDGQLHARMTSRQADQARKRIDAFVQFGAGQITQEIRFIEADVAFGYDWEWNAISLRPDVLGSNPTADRASQTMNAEFLRGIAQLYKTDPLNHATQIKPALVATISDRELGVLIHRVQSNNRCDILQAPKVTAFFGQVVSISDTAQRPFVTNVYTIRGELASACQPIIDVYDDGVAVHSHAVAMATGEIELSCAVYESKIDSVEHALLPIKADRDDKESINSVEIQVPKVHRSMVGSKVTLAKDQSLVIFSPKSYQPDKKRPNTKARFYVITPYVVVDEATTLREYVRRSPLSSN